MEEVATAAEGALTAEVLAEAARMVVVAASAAEVIVVAREAEGLTAEVVVVAAHIANPRF